MEEKKEELDEIKKTLDEKTETINKIRSVEVEIMNGLKEFERTLSQNQKALKHYQVEVSQLKLQKTG